MRGRRRPVLPALALLALMTGLAIGSRDGAPPGHGDRGHASLAVGGRPRALSSRERREQRAIDRVLAYTPYISRGSSRRREIALTFDDGPGPYTARLLGALRRMHVTATFFYVGQQLRYWGPTLRFELKHGFAVANHTQNHSMLPRLNLRAQRDQIVKASKSAAGWGAPAPRLFRPPFGAYDANTLRLLRRLRILMVLWTTDTADYRRPGKKAIVAAALRGARPGAIILMHDAGGIRDQTIAALPRIVRELRRRRYRLVTVPRLIVDDRPPRNQPLPPGVGKG
jgi:peptidoglycan/xylan/chitin deacetylase (PgdA/CDA1 family)